MKAAILCALVASPIALGLVGCCAGPTVAGEPSEADRGAVIAAVETLFEGMRDKDLESLARILSPKAVILRVDAESGESATTTVQDFLSTVERAPYQLNESMWDPEVRVDGPLAVLWAPYGFHRDAEFSHWGYDSFQLLRGDSGWRIVAIAYTRRTEPLRPPGA
jgi:hypothetical protein